MAHKVAHKVDSTSGAKPAPVHRESAWALNAGPDYWLEPPRDRRVPATAAGTARREDKASQRAGK
ncbi:MAG TPA: hypothetical protein VNS55_10845 [Nocardioides sp.]|nr:hypothetical protein [Nocardioides sp.]